MSRRCYDRDETIQDTLCRNIGRVCTIFTNTGGRAGGGFTGILSDVDEEVCSLVSAVPIGMDGGSGGGCRGGRCGGLGRGSLLTIPIDKINCVSTSQF